MKLYLAGPLFTLAEQRFNENLAEALQERRPDFEIILPQQRSKQFLGKPGELELIFADCLAMIDQCDCVVAILDGPDSDSGTCVELGYAWARRKPILGLRTDFRISEDRGLNLMVSHVCEVLILETSATLDAVTQQICNGIDSIRTTN